jgi:hypothetical protein
MASFKNTLIYLMVSMVICTTTVSCKPKGPLTKDQIIKIADRAVRQRGQNPKDYNVHFDDRPDGLRAAEGSELAKRNFVAVGYGPRGLTAGGILVVLVDKDTGTVLGVLGLQ